MFKDIFSNLSLGEDMIYSYDFASSGQDDEIKLRESIASFHYGDYLREVAKHHSIPVMDKEVKIFLGRIPAGGIVVDAGGCWGWHWRRNRSIRPDVTVVIVDFVRANLIHARNILGGQINDNIFLVHGDAASLVFDDRIFDGWWSVQALQHIPDFEKAVAEAWRVLKPGGIFANYSLNNQVLNRLISRARGRRSKADCQSGGALYLARASAEQLKLVEKIFANKVRCRYTEVIFNPELKTGFCGKEKSIIGKIDGFLSSGLPIFTRIARQKSFHTFKLNTGIRPS